MPALREKQNDVVAKLPDGDNITAQRRPRPAARRRRHGRRARRSPWVYWVRRAAVILVVLAIIPAWSVAGALTAPGTDTVPARLAEWARLHGMDWAVTGLEHVQYDFTQPSTGGTVAGGIPTAVDGSAAGPKNAAPTASPSLDRPPAALVPQVTNPLPGEGTWRPLLTAGNKAAAQVAFLRPDAAHTSYLVGVVWMDPHLLTFGLHPGYTVPGPVPGVLPQIPASQRGTILGTFNSGFQMKDANGGYWQNGHAVSPLRTGAASMVFTKDGRVDVQAWPGGTPPPGVTAVRQNLQLLIDNGTMSPLVANPSTSVWGKTVGNAAYVWRSGIGVRADGSIVFVVGPAMSVQTLANILQDAGAVRAMELDINRDWTNYLTYSHPSAGTATPHKLISSQVPNPYRYLQPSSRDFVAVSAR